MSCPSNKRQQKYRHIPNVAKRIVSSHKNATFFAGQQALLRFEGCFTAVSHKIQAFFAGHKIGLNKLVPFVKVLDTELSVGCASVIVFDDGIADIDRISGLDMVEIVGHIECDGRNMMVRM